MTLLNAVSAQKPREIAARILQRRQADRFTETLLEHALADAKMSTADRGLCQELVYGVVRWQATLDWLIAQKTNRRAQKAGLQNLLRLGLYQIFWLDRIPDHAAVHETVELAKRNGFGPQAGFVNAILRGFLREADATKKSLDQLKAAQLALGHSHPEWLVERWQKRWADERTRQLLEWNNTPPKTYARVNSLKTDAGKLLEHWREENVEYDFFRRDWCAENTVFELKSHPPLQKLSSFQQGFFYIQDPSTLFAVGELDPKPGEAILDLCAAPGGKTTYLAQLVRNEARIVAADVSTERLKLIQENCARLGVTCAELVLSAPTFPPRPDPFPLGGGEGESSSVASHVGEHEKIGRCDERVKAPSSRRIAEADGRIEGNPQAVPLSHPMGEGSGVRAKDFSPIAHRQFDRVLVDAPCSNTGVMRRRVDLRWRTRLEEIERLRAAQLELLRQAATRVKPRGILVYSTCSLEPEENGEVVQRFLREQNGFKLERERELLPFGDGVDGAYVARIQRT
jgi:16S rRNA (cytosine967-C5)-methyltransferase